MSRENQHWVPKFLIKNFVAADGRVFCLNVQTDEITKLPPKRAASSIGFNDFLMGGETVSFEDHLEKIETSAAPILRQIVSARSVAGLSEAHRKGVADFMAAQSFRTEAFYKGLDLQSHQQFGPFFAELWRGAFLVSAEFVRRKWVVMSIDHDDVFYLGHHPVVLQDTKEPSAEKELGFDINGVEAFLPLAPHCALYMPCTSTSQEIISDYENAERVVELREATAAAQLIQISERIIRNSHALYKALTTGVALAVASENVENLNYLQCFWAHTTIYSNRRDFSFARRVFREHPEYRNTVKVRLAMFGAT
jgi:hypothetical protein